MSDEELLDWFKVFSSNLNDMDLKCLTLFIENMNRKYKLGQDNAFLLGISTGKEIVKHGTH